MQPNMTDVALAEAPYRCLGEARPRETRRAGSVMTPIRDQPLHGEFVLGRTRRPPCPSDSGGGSRISHGRVRGTDLRGDGWSTLTGIRLLRGGRGVVRLRLGRQPIVHSLSPPRGRHKGSVNRQSTESKPISPFFQRAIATSICPLCCLFWPCMTHFHNCVGSSDRSGEVPNNLTASSA